MRDGAIHVRGRLKEIIVMSTGEKVAPADLEMAITADPLVDQAVVVGEGRPFLAALLVLQPRSWEQLAAGCGLDPRSPDALRAEAARTLVLDKTARLLHAFPAHAQIHAVALLLDEWSIHNGLLTPTLKVKRSLIEERYASAIDALYAGHSQPA
jgi:long-chain acyl-CoA synthetase